MKSKLLPKLRFPEFQNDPAWEEKKLGEIGEFIGGGTPSKDIPEYWLGSIPWISSSDLNDEIHQINISRYITETAIIKSSTKLIPPNSIIIVSRVGVGKLAINSKSLCTSQDFINMIPAYMNNTIFLAYLIKLTIKRRLIFNQGTSIKGFVKSDFVSIKVPIPSLPEQQKIADCLSSLDSLIELHSQKLDQLVEYKSGLMQNLFPQGGKKVPRLRYPEFQNAPEWEEKKLGEIANVVRGGSPRPIDNYITTDKDGLNWLKIGDVHQDSKYIINTREKVVHDALKKSREVTVGDLILSNSMSFGRPYIMRISACIHDGWIAITKNTLNNDFLYYFISSPKSQSYFNHNASGGVVQNLNLNIVGLLPLFFPSLPEQQKIADLLSSVDELISGEKDKIESLKEHKLGLIQQLFPSSDDNE